MNQKLGQWELSVGFLVNEIQQMRPWLCFALVIALCFLYATFLMKALVRVEPQDHRVDMCNGGGGSCTTASIKPVGEDTDESVDRKRQDLRFLSTLERAGVCDRC